MMFCIYGRSRIKAKKSFNKSPSKTESDKMDKYKDASIVSRQKVADYLINEKFNEQRIARISQEFSTPDIAKECLVMMEKDKFNFAECELMMKVNKQTADLKVKHNKKGKPLMQWVEYKVSIRDM